MRFDSISEEMASGEIRQIFHEIRRAMGLARVPRFFRSYGRNAPVLRGLWALFRAVLLDSAAVPRTTKELVALAIAAGPTGSDYFREFHRRSLQATGVDPDIVNALADEGDSPLLPERTRRLIAFARRIAAAEPAEDADAGASAEQAMGISAGETQAFRREGLDPVAVGEVIALAAGVRTLNACARVMGVRPEVDPRRQPSDGATPSKAKQKGEAKKQKKA